MILTIILVSLAFGYLVYVTDYFRIRLQAYSKIVLNNTPDNVKTPYYWQKDKSNMLLCQGCRLKCNKSKEQWTGWKLAARTIKAFGHTMNFEEQCVYARAKLLKDVASAQTRQKPVTFKPTQLPLFIEQVRTGSHEEWTRWNEETKELDIIHKYKKGYIHRVVTDYTTHYNDCLCGKDWLKEHEHFEYPEPTMELIIDEKSFHVNGNYHKGLISDTIKPYTAKVKIGRKMVTIDKNGG